jgi:hypothetical protein
LGSSDLDAFVMDRTDAERFESWVIALMLTGMTREDAEREVALSMLVEEAQARGAYETDPGYISA